MLSFAVELAILDRDFATALAAAEANELLRVKSDQLSRVVEAAASAGEFGFAARAAARIPESYAQSRALARLLEVRVTDPSAGRESPAGDTATGTQAVSVQARW